MKPVATGDMAEMAEKSSMRYKTPLNNSYGLLESLNRV